MGGVLVKALVERKALATLAAVHCEGIQAAYAGPGVVDGAPVFFEENAALLISAGFQNKDGVSVCEHGGMRVFGINILDTFDDAGAFPKESPQPVCVKGFQHHRIRDMAAALSAALTGK
jgi:hypothetical protein